MSKFKIPLCLIILISFTYSQYRCDWWVISAGGTRIGINNLYVSSSVGQVAIGLINIPLLSAQIGFWVIDTPFVGIKENQFQKFPLKTELLPIKPNLIIKNTQIYYSLSKESDVSIIIYNLNGEVINRQFFQRQKPGIYSFNFPIDKIGKGVYFLNFSAGEYKTKRKIILLH